MRAQIFLPSYQLKNPVNFFPASTSAVTGLLSLYDKLRKATHFVSNCDWRLQNWALVW